MALRHPHQYGLDFQSRNNERFARLITALDRTRANEKVRALMLLVFNMTKDGEHPFAESLRAIGARFHRSEDTARRWVRAAAGLGLLSVREHQHGPGGWRPYDFAVNWSVVDRLAAEPDAGSGRGSNDDDRGRRLPPRGSSVRPGRGRELRPPIKESYCSPLLTHSSSPPSTMADTSLDGARAAWQPVEEAVFQAGVNQARKAIAAVRSHGGTPADVLALLAYWQPRKAAWNYPEFELYQRLRRWRRGDAVAAGWTGMSPAFVAAQRRAREVADREARHAVAAHAAAAERDRRVAERAGQAALEAEFGDQVRALSADEREQLGSAQAGPAWPVLRGLPQLAHETLLAAVATPRGGDESRSAAPVEVPS